MGGKACAVAYSNQPLCWPECTSTAVVLTAEVGTDGNQQNLGKLIRTFAEGVGRDWALTNRHTVGKAAKFGAGVLAAPVVAAGMGSKTPFAWAWSRFGPLPYEYTTKLGGGVGNIQWTTLTRGQRLARVAMSSGKNFILVTAAFETGVLIGAVVNQFLSEDVQDAIGGTINEVVNEGGYRLLWEQPFGIQIK